MLLRAPRRTLRPRNPSPQPAEPSEESQDSRADPQSRPAARSESPALSGKCPGKCPDRNGEPRGAGDRPGVSDRGRCGRQHLATPHHTQRPPDEAGQVGRSPWQPQRQHKTPTPYKFHLRSASGVTIAFQTLAALRTRQSTRSPSPIIPPRQVKC